MGITGRRGYAIIEFYVAMTLFCIGVALSVPVAQHSHQFILSRYAAAGAPLGSLPHLAAAGAGLLMALVALGLPFVGLALLLYSGQVCIGIWRQFQQALHDFRGCWEDRG